MKVQSLTPVSYTDKQENNQKLIKSKKIGNLGRALIKASREHKDEVWLKNMYDEFFNKLRKEKHARGKQNSRNHL